MKRLTLEDYRTEFTSFLAEQELEKQPKNLYKPITYIINLGGKRMRPVLTLMATDLFGGNTKNALHAALAVEIFHNFSLVHDDIMDDAPLRRGQETVHEKWDLNTGILSGDAMLILAYRCLEVYEGEVLGQLLSLFSKTAIEVCEGQQFDIDFETRNDVSLSEYLKMIEFKTSVLVAAALKMGAIIAEANVVDQNLIYEFGRNLGIAFQLQDDYLDAFGDPKTFGKQVGGDIIENKKTFLYLRALQLADDKSNKTLLDLYSIQPQEPMSKITVVKDIFETSGAVTEIRNQISFYTDQAFKALAQIDIDAERKRLFHEFGTNLMQRTV